MSNLTALLLFAIFGGVCGFHLSVTGFAITAVGICILVGVASALLDGPFTPWFLLALFGTLQVGFFLALIGRAVTAHLMRLRVRHKDGEAEAEFRGERDRT